MADEAGLTAQSVHEFVDRVASPREAVPAGGSVSALTGSSSAALLVLVCSVLERRGTAGLGRARQRATQLQAHLLTLVETDAEAFRALMAARRSGQDVGAAIERTSQIPLDIARASLQVAVLSDEVERSCDGPLLGDVRAARHLARAAALASLDLAEQDVQLHAGAEARLALRREISLVRQGLGAFANQ